MPARNPMPHVALLLLTLFVVTHWPPVASAFLTGPLIPVLAGAAATVMTIGLALLGAWALASWLIR